MTFYIILGIIPTLLAIHGNIKTVFRSSKHSTMHCFEGLLPMALCSMFLWSSLSFSEIAWTKPIFALAPIFFYFSLNCSRCIIATVTKQEYSVFIDFHLTLPIICCIIIIPANQAFDLIKEEQLFAGFIIVNIMAYFWYITIVIGQITDFLGIHCLTIKKKVD
jgi:hypothetical protein